MKLLIGGSRIFNDYTYLKNEIDKIRKNNEITCIISGGANGADLLAKKYAFENKIPYEEYLPNWDKYGKKAGILRNIEMIKRCDKAVFFWDSRSPGTKQAINYSMKENKLFNVFFFNEIW